MSTVRSLLCLAVAGLIAAVGSPLGAGTPGRAEQLLVDGNAALEAGDLQAAEAAFAEALAQGGGARAHDGLGRTCSADPGRRRDAERHFKRALKADPDYVDAQYDLGMLYAEWRPKQAAKAFQMVLEIAPRHPDAAYQVGRALLRRKADPHEALSWFQRQLETRPGHPGALLAAGRLLIQMGDREAGVGLVEKAVEAADSAGGPADLEMARVRLDEGAFEEAQRLFEAYIGSLPKPQQRAFTDPEFVAGQDALEMMERRAGADSAGIRSRFWKALDPTPITPVNERLLEHYRRVAFALEHYSLEDGGMDRRGEVYVRYGPPDHVSRWDDIRIERDRDLQDIRTEFVNRSQIGFNIPPGQPIFPVKGTAQWEYWLYGAVDGGIEITFVKEFEGRGYDYAPMPPVVSVTVGSELTKLDPGQVMERATLKQPSTYGPAFADLALDFHYYTAGYRGPGDLGRLEVYYGLPATEVARLKVDARSDLILLDRGVVLFDSLWTEAYRVVDQVAFSSPTELQVEEGAFIPGVLSVDLRPGPYRMALQVRDVVSGKSQVYREDLVVEDYHGDDALRMSDIELAFAIARTEAEDEYTKHGLRVVPMSSRTFRADQSAFVYFEIYNLARNEFGQTQYRVAYEIRAQEKRSAPARILHGLGRVLNLSRDDTQVSVAYEQTGSRPAEVAYVELDLTESGAGEQRVRVEVTDLVVDRAVHRDIRFTVAPPR